MSDRYICDICSGPTPRGEIRFLSAATIHRAIRNGFNPWKTPGIDMSTFGLGSLFGLSPDAMYLQWRQRALADMTDWGLCRRCDQAVTAGEQPLEMKPGT